MHFHITDPTALIESAFRRILGERMAGMPMLNPALHVAAVGFYKVDDSEWRGAVVTPWCLNLLLLPARADWKFPLAHARVFRHYAAGDFAFLGNSAAGLGEYLACPLFHDMQQFADHETAVMTARASLIALDLAPPAPASEPAGPLSSARRKFLTLGV